MIFAVVGGYKHIGHDGTSEVVWSQKINSVINEDKPFDLADFKIDIQAQDDRGTALASWTHTKGIINSYVKNEIRI